MSAMRVSPSLPTLNFDSFMDSGSDTSGRSSPRLNTGNTVSSTRPGFTRASPGGQDESPVGPKRRRMNSDSPLDTRDSPARPTPSLAIPGSPYGYPGREDMVRSPSFDEWSDSNMSNVSGCNDSPPQKKKYGKDELWAAIQSDYHYLMDEGIIETCKVTFHFT